MKMKKMRHNPRVDALFGRLLFCLLLVFWLGANALRAADVPQRQVAVFAGRLIDVQSGTISQHVYVSITGDRITAVSASAPANVAVIDLSKYTIVPGLIDCHAHILSDPTTQAAGAELMRSAPQATVRGVHNLQLWLAHGFTAVRDAGESYRSYPQFALREGVANNLISGPRIVSAGGFISVTGGHGDSDSLAPDKPALEQPNLADTVDDVSRAVRRDIKFGADWIKLMATGGVMDPISDYQVQELSEEQMVRAVEVAHRAGRKVMAHAEGTVGIKAAVRAGVDSIEHGTMLDEEGARMMSERGTWLVPTLYCFQHDLQTGLSKGRDPRSMAKGIAIVKEQGPAFRRALQHHVKVAYGVDDDDVDASVSKEFGALVRGGMTPQGALQAATINGARLLGLDKDMGTIEPGKLADLVAVEGEPLDDITAMERVVWVMKSGEVVKPLGR